MKNLGDRIIRLRWIIIPFFILTAVFFASQIPRAEIESEMKSMLPSYLESRINTEKIDELFGGTEMIMLIIKADDVLDPETLQRTKSISRQMKRIKVGDKVLFGKYAGQELNISGDDYLLITQSDILLISN